MTAEHDRPLERALTGLAAAQRQAVRRRAGRLVLEERIRHMEQELADLRGRLTGLIFLVLGAELTQLLVRLL